MPSIYTEENAALRHTDEIHDIITAVPSWILKWGITVFFFFLILIFSLSSLIQYPDVINTSMSIESPNSPKPIVAKVSGKLAKLLVKESTLVSAGQILGFVESTASHTEVLSLLDRLKALQTEAAAENTMKDVYFTQSDNPALGEIQASYQTFFQAFLSYKSALNGFYVKKKNYLQKDLLYLVQQRAELNAQKLLQQKDLSLADEEFAMHKKLESEKVETKAEYRQEQSKYLAKKFPLVQTETSLIAADANFAAKQKEILELDNEIVEEKAKFFQALNSLISKLEDWKSKYVLSASQAGRISFAGIIQENQVLTVNQEVFYINPGNEQFFGEMTIPQDNMGKVKEGQDVLIKLKSYPFEQYGMIHGKISYISDAAYKDSIFLSKVDFRITAASNMKRSIRLKPGMVANAEIITQKATILQRITRNLIKLLNNK